MDKIKMLYQEVQECIGIINEDVTDKKAQECLKYIEGLLDGCFINYFKEAKDEI